MELLDRTALREQLTAWGHAAWAQQIEELCGARFSTNSHGGLAQWIRAWHELPPASEGRLETSGGVVRVAGRNANEQQLRDTLMKFHPWRKGPFEFFGLKINSEWRSDWKWNRLADAVGFAGKRVLDIGCGNGYYGWRMLEAGAECVLGCDPFLLYVLQFEAFRKYETRRERHFVAPLADVELPNNLRLFDVTISMGVLYHRTSPIDHLQKLGSTLVPGGQLVLETLVLQSEIAEVLVPPDRYAKMRNVWFVPSIPMLRVWLERTGFENIEVIDVTRTSLDEQRRTDWMTFESLRDFLDEKNPEKTVEGHPAPVRAIVVARTKYA